MKRTLGPRRLERGEPVRRHGDLASLYSGDGVLGTEYVLVFPSVLLDLRKGLSHNVSGGRKARAVLLVDNHFAFLSVLRHAGQDRIHLLGKGRCIEEELLVLLRLLKGRLDWRGRNLYLLRGRGRHVGRLCVFFLVSEGYRGGREKRQRFSIEVVCIASVVVFLWVVWYRAESVWRGGQAVVKKKAAGASREPVSIYRRIPKFLCFVIDKRIRLGGPHGLPYLSTLAPCTVTPFKPFGDLMSASQQRA